MNTVIVSGTVIVAPEMQERSAGPVWIFRLAIDTRKSGARPTEATVCCWREVGRYLAQYLAVGDRVVATGSLGHMAGYGLVVSALQLLRLASEEVLGNVEQRAADAEEEPNERNWADFLGRPPEARR